MIKPNRLQQKINAIKTGVYSERWQQAEKKYKDSMTMEFLLHKDRNEK